MAVDCNRLNDMTAFATTNVIANLIKKYGTAVFISEEGYDEYKVYILPVKGGMFYMAPENGDAKKMENYMSFHLFNKSLEDLLADGYGYCYEQEEEQEEQEGQEGQYLGYWKLVELSDLRKGGPHSYWRNSILFEDKYNHTPKRGECSLNEHLLELQREQKLISSRKHCLSLSQVIEGANNRHQYCLQGIKMWAREELPLLYMEIKDMSHEEVMSSPLLHKKWKVSSRMFMRHRNPLL